GSMALRSPFFPLGLVSASEAPVDWPRLAGGWRACAAVRIPEGLVAEAAQALPRAFSRSRPAFAGLPMDRPHIMGILNVTPDSFSDGGDRSDLTAFIDHGRAMAAQGAAIIDVGGESTRPDAPAVDPEVEAARVVPVVRALAEAGLLVSIDTRRASVMAAALDAGARIVNDVSALEDPAALPLVASRQVPTILMHMRGTPATMRGYTVYEDVLAEVYEALEKRIAACRQAGMGDELLCVDPGIGFAKNTTQNLVMMRALASFHGLGVPVLLGASRKRFIDESVGAKERLAGSITAAAAAWEAGVQLIRVHDVAETAQARALWQAINGVE
ncbi:dihydropteroate synthase, partial [Lacibacterium aquatile]